MQDVIAAGLNLPGSDIFGTMSFYSMFAWKPKGKYIVRMCQSPPCHINGAENMLLALQEELGLTAGQTTADGLFTLELSACLGVCEVAPAMQINELVYGNLTREKIRQVLADYRAGKVAGLPAAAVFHQGLPPATSRVPMSRCSWIMWASSIPWISRLTWTGAVMRP